MGGCSLARMISQPDKPDSATAKTAARVPTNAAAADWPRTGPRRAARRRAVPDPAWVLPVPVLAGWEWADWGWAVHPGAPASALLPPVEDSEKLACRLTIRACCAAATVPDG